MRVVGGLVPTLRAQLPQDRRQAAGARTLPAARADIQFVVVPLIVVIGAFVSWLRLPATTSATLWAEDSRNFLGDVVRHGPFAPAWQIYAGYLHTVPRILAALTVTFVPIPQWAHAISAASCVVVGIVAAAVFVCSRVVTESWLVRAGLAAVTVLAPLAPREVLGNAANLHWYFLWLAPWLILYRSRSGRGTALLTIIAFLGALTEVQMLAFVPLMVLRWRTGARLPVRVAILVGGVFQIAASLTAPRGHSGAVANRPASTVYGYAINSAMTIWSGNSHVIGWALVRFGPAAPVAALLPVVLAAVWVFRFGTRDQRWMVTTLLVSSLVLWVVAVKTNPGPYYEYASMTRARLATPWLSRYGVVPSMELLAILVIALGVHRRSPGPARSDDARVRRTLAPRAVVGLVLLVCALVSFVPSATRRSSGPEFAPQVMAAERSCSGRAVTTPVVLLSPPHPNWKITIDCGRLTSRLAPGPVRKADPSTRASMPVPVAPR
ncbi:hypothetical protein GCM10022256_29960 [Frondihabitans peucedani]|uniref:Uncharacterized protein n=1 Tax=Frondihabitans peucedani TaxID=598626 RepID=A0ABP8E5J1_9MICO